MRINEDYIDSISDDDLTTTIVEDDHYDAVIVVCVVNYPEPATPQYLKKIQRFFLFSPEISQVDVLDTEVVDEKKFTLKVFADKKEYKLRISGSTKYYHYLALGLKGNVYDISKMLKLIAQFANAFRNLTRNVDFISIFDLETNKNNTSFFSIYPVNVIKGNLSEANEHETFLKSLDSVNTDFNNFVTHMSRLCQASMKNVLEAIFKTYELSEVFLRYDVGHSTKEWKIAKNSETIFRKHQPVNLKVFKNNISDTSFTRHKRAPKETIAWLDFQDLNDLFGYNYKKDVCDCVYNADVRYPQFATIGTKRRTLQTYEYEFVVPVKMEEDGVIMLIIKDSARDWFMDALLILYPDLTQNEKSQVIQELSSLQKKI